MGTRGSAGDGQGDGAQEPTTTDRAMDQRAQFGGARGTEVGSVAGIEFSAAAVAAGVEVDVPWAERWLER